MQIVSEQVTQEIHRSLKNMGLAPLSSDNSVSLVGQLQNIAKKENCVRSVIGERAHVWATRVLGGAAMEWVHLRAQSRGFSSQMERPKGGLQQESCPPNLVKVAQGC